MLAQEKWQVKTIAVLERVFQERNRQVQQYGHNEDLEDGVGPDVRWLAHTDVNLDLRTGKEIQVAFRGEYERYTKRTGKPTWMHLVREELAEAFELSGDDPEFVTEILQVAALCVSWAEKKL